MSACFSTSADIFELELQSAATRHAYTGAQTRLGRAVPAAILAFTASTRLFQRCTNSATTPFEREASASENWCDGRCATLGSTSFTKDTKKPK